MSGYTFADEFAGPAGSAPDPSKWAYDVGAGAVVGGNQELERYTSSRANSYLDGQGHLVIAATRNGSGWDSARLKTQGKFSQLGGHFAARIKLDSQPGCWPAFWMLGADAGTVGWPQCGEIDILEDYGTSWTESSVHCPNGSGSVYTQSAGLSSDTAWHTYQLDWTGTTMVFSRDGASYLTVTRSQFPASSWVYGPGTPNNGGMFLIMNIAVGGTGPGGPPPALVQFPVTMLVDYVRAWS